MEEKVEKAVLIVSLGLVLSGAFGVVWTVLGIGLNMLAYPADTLAAGSLVAFALGSIGIGLVEGWFQEYL